MPVDPWLARAAATPEVSARVKVLMADMIEDGLVRHETIILRGKKPA